MKLYEIKEIANDTGVYAERGYNLKNFAKRIIELDRQQRKWIGLAKSERSELWWSMDWGRTPEHTYGKAIEAKLKERNT